MSCFNICSIQVFVTDNIKDGPSTIQFKSVKRNTQLKAVCAFSVYSHFLFSSQIRSLPRKAKLPIYPFALWGNLFFSTLTICSW